VQLSAACTNSVQTEDFLKKENDSENQISKTRSVAIARTIYHRIIVTRRILKYSKAYVTNTVIAAVLVSGGRNISV
jgi:hypothetical protein